MSVKRIFAIIGIFVFAVLGWFVLGTAVNMRSGEMNSGLRDKVYSLCGQPLIQKCPVFSEKIPGSNQVKHVAPSANKVKVELFLEQRRKGLLWFPVFRCGFTGEYSITNNEPSSRRFVVHFDFPSPDATYDSFKAEIDGQPLNCEINTANGIDALLTVPSGQTRAFRVQYLSRGVGAWTYKLQSGNASRIDKLEMQVTTDFADIDYPEQSISPLKSEISSSGAILTWQAENLITKHQIGIVMPQKINPGPLVARITFFAPVCLIFFFVALMATAIVGKIDIHPMHYLFVAAGFFAFHLLFAYLVDLVNVHVAFILSTVVTLGLVNIYLRGTLGAGFPWKKICLAQVFYLILFSYSFFLKGITGLTITIGSIITLSILMFITRNINWTEFFYRPPAGWTPPPLPGVATTPEGIKTNIGVEYGPTDTDS